MAGHNKPAISVDPAVTKYNDMLTNRYKYFRWTPRTAWITIVYVFIVPGAIGYMGYKTEGKWNMRAKLRGDTISEF